MSILDDILALGPHSFFAGYEAAGRTIVGGEYQELADLAGGGWDMIPAGIGNTPVVPAVDYPSVFGTSPLPETSFNLGQLAYRSGGLDLGDIRSYTLFFMAPADKPKTGTRFHLLSRAGTTPFTSDRHFWVQEGAAAGEIGRLSLNSYVLPEGANTPVADTPNDIPGDATEPPTSSWWMWCVRREFVSTGGRNGVSTWKAYALWDHQDGTGCHMSEADAVESGTLVDENLEGIGSNSTGVFGAAAYFDRAISDDEIRELMRTAGRYISAEASDCIFESLGGVLDTVDFPEDVLGVGEGLAEREFTNEQAEALDAQRIRFDWQYDSELQTVTLGDRTIRLGARYNRAVGGWYLDIYQQDGTPILLGKRIRPGISPTLRHELSEYLPAGLIVVSGRASGRESLGRELFITFYPAAQLEEAADRLKVDASE